MPNEKIEKKLKSASYPKPRKFHHISFKHAFDGIKWAFKTQPNFKIHTLAFAVLGILITLFSYISLLNSVEVTLLLISAGMVFTTEMINTSIEAVSDEVAKEEYKDLVRVAKDCSSGAVLVSTIFALLIATIIFIPKVLFLFSVSF